MNVTQVDLETLRQMLLDLFCQNAYKEGDFTLSSGKKSTYYINGKQVTLHPLGAVMVGRLMLSKLPDDTVAIAGLTLGADPIVSSVSTVGVYENRTITPLIIRKEAKGHGTRAYIEGPELPEGSKVVVLEDVVTTGQSALKAVERLQQAGYTVERVLSLVERQEGGAELYAEKGLQFEAIFSIQDLQQHWVKVSAG